MHTSFTRALPSTPGARRRAGGQVGAPQQAQVPRLGHQGGDSPPPPLLSPASPAQHAPLSAPPAAGDPPARAARARYLQAERGGGGAQRGQRQDALPPPEEDQPAPRLSAPPPRPGAGASLSAAHTDAVGIASRSPPHPRHKSLRLDPAQWGDDAHEWKPERWAEGVPHPFAYAPFSHGPRACIGKEFTLTEQKICAVKLLQHFIIQKAAGDWAKQPGATKLKESEWPHYPACSPHYGVDVEYNPKQAFTGINMPLELHPRPQLHKPEAAKKAEAAAQPAVVFSLDESSQGHATPLSILYGSDGGSTTELAERVMETAQEPRPPPPLNLRLISAHLGSSRLISARLGSARPASARLGSSRLISAHLGSSRLGPPRPASAQLHRAISLRSSASPPPSSRSTRPSATRRSARTGCCSSSPRPTTAARPPTPAISSTSAARRSRGTRGLWTLASPCSAAATRIGQTLSRPVPPARSRRVADVCLAVSCPRVPLGDPDAARRVPREDRRPQAARPPHGRLEEGARREAEPGERHWPDALTPRLRPVQGARGGLRGVDRQAVARAGSGRRHQALAACGVRRARFPK